jgi:hypothetical protein
MTFSNGSNPGTMIEAKLPRRDWILLPMIALLTVCLIAVPTELIARRLFTESRPFVPSCMGPALFPTRYAETRNSKVTGLNINSIAADIVQG